MTFLKVFIGFVFLVAAEVNATTRYLDGNITPTSCTTYSIANRNCNGNDGTAYKTWAAAMQAGTMVAGDKLVIRGGSYGSPDQLPSGTSWTNAITFERYQSETVKLGNIKVFNTTAAYIIFDGVTFPGFNTGQGSGPFWLRNCEVTGSTTHGIVLSYSGAGGNIVQDCTVHDIGTTGYDHGFYIVSSNNLIERNHVYNVTGTGIKNGQGDFGAMSGNVIRYNKVHDFATYIINDGNAGGWGINNASNNNGTLIHNNVVYGCPTNSPYSDTASMAVVTSSGVKIYNNTLVGNGRPNCKGLVMLYPNIVGLIVRNNIITGHSTNIDDRSLPGATFSNNLCSVAGTGCAIVADPKFVNPAAGDFRIQSGSPAINAGTSSIASGISLSYTGSAPDVGAYPYSDSASAGVRPSAPLNLNATVLK